MEKILIASTEWGHGSIAKSIGETVNKHYDIEIHSIKIEKFSKVSYEFIYKFIPGFFRVVFALTEIDIINQLFNHHVEKSYKMALESEIKKVKPKIVINTYFAFNSSLEALKDKYGFRFINFLANPWTFNKIEVSRHAENLVFDEYSLKKIKTLNPNAPAAPVGWFTERKFYDIEEETRKNIRKRLGIDQNKFTLCITSGSEGTYNVLKIINTFLNPKYNIQVLIMCGNNTQLVKTVRTLKKVSKVVQGPEITAIPYTRNIHKFIRASDIVVGKAGPNTIFESVATLTPFFAISHVSGQEDGNLGIIKNIRLAMSRKNLLLQHANLKKLLKIPKS